MDAYSKAPLNTFSTDEKRERKVEVVSCTVLDLFNCSETLIPGSAIIGKITIPEYQRPYLWGEKEIGKLLANLQSHFKLSDKSRPMYYIGSIILHAAEGKLNIIDGQQRITTLALLQAIIKKEVPNIPFYSPVSVENIQRNYRYLLLKGESLKEVDLSQINITCVVTDSEDEAYTFFETQNTGGVRLTGVDIIKAHHLREISQKGNRQSEYAITWEKQRSMDAVIECLIKARRWGILNWKNVPSDRDAKGIRRSIIKDFSEDTLPFPEKLAFKQAVVDERHRTISFSCSNFSIRQPLANGENFIDYLEEYCTLYRRLFCQSSDPEIDERYFMFYKKVIGPVDGTAFIKELFEIALLCYCSKFGFDSIYEASLWIFRSTYSKRVSTGKMVREDSIPKFIKEENHLIDTICASFNHQELMGFLKRFKYTFNQENTEGNTVKSRFIGRIATYFSAINGTSNTEQLKKDFDTELKLNIEKLTDGAKV